MLFNKERAKAAKLNKSNILSSISEYSIFCNYIGYKFRVGEKFNSPFRKDRNPSFGIFKAKNGSLLYKDLATGDSGANQWLPGRSLAPEESLIVS